MTAGGRRAVQTAIAGALTLSLVSPAAADFQAGLTAYQRSDYAAALREWLPVADAGNTTARRSASHRLRDPSAADSARS